jgi:hypothetical protein
VGPFEHRDGLCSESSGNGTSAFHWSASHDGSMLSDRGYWSGREENAMNSKKGSKDLLLIGIAIVLACLLGTIGK